MHRGHVNAKRCDPATAAFPVLEAGVSHQHPHSAGNIGDLALSWLQAVVQPPYLTHERLGIMIRRLQSRFKVNIATRSISNPCVPLVPSGGMVVSVLVQCQSPLLLSCFKNPVQTSADLKTLCIGYNDIS
jgi:hypothetical protein